MSLGEAANYALLSLENGTMRIDKASTVIGDLGYSKGVTSPTNRKIGEGFFGEWTGTAFVHSGVATFEHDPNYMPTGGIVTNPSEDDRLDRANADALAHSAWASSLPATANLGALKASLNLGSIDGQRTVHILEVTSLDMNKSDVLSLTGDAADVFVFNVRGNFHFTESEIRLIGGITAGHVLFNLSATNNVNQNVQITKPKAFRGTILATNLGKYRVDYKYAGSFVGAIIASRIEGHDEFSLEHAPFTGLVCLCEGAAATVVDDLPSCNSASDPVLTATPPVISQVSHVQATTQHPNLPFLLVGSFGEPPPVIVPDLGCTIYVDVQDCVTFTVSDTDSNGSLSWGIQVPSSCEYIGMLFVLQGAILTDAVAGPIPGWLSNGVRMTVGLPQD